MSVKVKICGLNSRDAAEAALFVRIRRKYLPIKHDPNKRNYMDLAITPVTDEEEARELFQSSAAQAYLNQEHRLEKIRAGAGGHVKSHPTATPVSLPEVTPQG